MFTISAASAHALDVAARVAIGRLPGCAIPASQLFFAIAPLTVGSEARPLVDGRAQYGRASFFLQGPGYWACYWAWSASLEYTYTMLAEDIVPKIVSPFTVGVLVFWLPGSPQAPGRGHAGLQ